MKRLRLTLIAASTFFLGAMPVLSQDTSMCVHQDDEQGECTVQGDPSCAATDVADSCFGGGDPETDPCGAINVTVICLGQPPMILTTGDCCDAG